LATSVYVQIGGVATGKSNGKVGDDCGIGIIRKFVNEIFDLCR
jgi:hypothetical protein